MQKSKPDALTLLRREKLKQVQIEACKILHVPVPKKKKK